MPRENFAFIGADVGAASTNGCAENGCKEGVCGSFSITVGMLFVGFGCCSNGGDRVCSGVRRTGCPFCAMASPAAMENAATNPAARSTRPKPATGPSLFRESVIRKNFFNLCFRSRDIPCGKEYGGGGNNDDEKQNQPGNVSHSCSYD